MSSKSSKTKPVSVRLPNATVERLDGLCASTQKSRAQIIDDLINRRTVMIQSTISVMAQLSSMRAAVIDHGTLDEFLLERLETLILSSVNGVLDSITGGQNDE